MLEGDTVVMKIKGVNLGNWLVLEKWMSSELFKGVDADDEEGLTGEKNTGSRS